MNNQHMIFERKPYEESPAETISQTVGLLAAVGLLIGAIIGVLLANAYLDTSLATEWEFLIGALAGGAVGVSLSTLLVHRMTQRAELDSD